MSGWKIDRDYINSDLGPEFYRVGTHSQGWSEEMRNHPEARRFRLKDDDGNVYYGGWLLEAEDGESTGYSLLMFGQTDAGAVDLDIKEAGKWIGYM